MTSQQVSILAVNSGDIASYNQAKYLLAKFNWEELGAVEGKSAYRYNDVRMWMFENGILFEDDIDKRWHKQTGELVSEVIFPSRHAAASGKPSLTLHPIGVPHLLKDEHPKFGGKSGYAAPPSTRLSSWWKMLQNYVEGTDLANQFELTLEVTHHGPWLEVPALFIEIGSTEETWPHEGAAELLASIISDGMGFTNGKNVGLWDGNENAGELVLVTLGSCAFAIDPFTPQALDVAKNPPRLPCDGIRIRAALKDASTLGQTSSRETNSLDADGLHHDRRMPTDLFPISSHQCIHCSFIWSHARY